MPQNSNFRPPRGHRFWPKSDLTVMAPNHGGNPWGPSWGQWGPIGSKKWVKTVKNYHAPKFEFSTTPLSSIAAKIRHYGYGAKSRWGPPRVHLGAYGVPLGPKYGAKPWKITMPQNSNFLQPRGHRLRPKSDITVMAPNYGGDPLGSILGPMGSHWVQKMGQNLRKLRCPKIRIFNYPAVIHFGQNPTLGLWRQITVGTPKGPSWGQWGPIGSKKWVKTVKNYHAPKFEFSTTPRSSITSKIKPYGYGAKSRWGPPGVHLGAGPMGSHWVQNMGQNRKKLPCPKIRIFDHPAVIVFGQNPIWRLWRQITVETP